MPSHMGIFYDAGSASRKELDPNYKSNRPRMPQDLVSQLPLIAAATEAFGLPCLRTSGVEADDLIATYARISGENGLQARIFSSDKDLMQLVSPSVGLFDPVKWIEIDREAVIARFGVAPEHVCDAQALIGDKVDNVPGVPGVGLSRLRTFFGNLEASTTSFGLPTVLNRRGGGWQSTITGIRFCVPASSSSWITRLPCLWSWRRWHTGHSIRSACSIF